MWNWNGIDSRGGTRHILAQARVIAHHSGPLDATWMHQCRQPGAISPFNWIELQWCYLGGITEYKWLLRSILSSNDKLFTSS